MVQCELGGGGVHSYGDGISCLFWIIPNAERTEHSTSTFLSTAAKLKVIYFINRTLRISVLCSLLAGRGHAIALCFSFVAAPPSPLTRIDPFSI